MKLEPHEYKKFFEELFHCIIKKRYKGSKPLGVKFYKPALFTKKINKITNNDYLLYDIGKYTGRKSIKYFYRRYDDAKKNLQVEIDENVLYNILCYMDFELGEKAVDNDTITDKAEQILELFLNKHGMSRSYQPANENKVSSITEMNDINKTRFIFDNTFWSLYESFGSQIARRPLHFKNTNHDGSCDVVLKPFQEGLADWVGKAHYLKRQGCLVITLNHSLSGSNYNHLLIQIEERTEKLEVCTGQITYCSDKNQNIVSKLIVMCRDTNITRESISEAFDYDSGEIPEVVKRFFKIVSPSVFGFQFELSVYDEKSLNDALDNREKGVPGYQPPI